jgi:hypothetical protein
VNGQFHIPAVLVPVTDCELVGSQRQGGRSEEINRLSLPTIEPRFLCKVSNVPCVMVQLMHLFVIKH